MNLWVCYTNNMAVESETPFEITSIGSETYENRAIEKATKAVVEDLRELSNFFGPRGLNPGKLGRSDVERGIVGVMTADEYQHTDLENTSREYTEAADFLEGTNPSGWKTAAVVLKEIITQTKSVLEIWRQQPDMSLWASPDGRHPAEKEYERNLWEYTLVFKNLISHITPAQKVELGAYVISRWIHETGDELEKQLRTKR